MSKQYNKRVSFEPKDGNKDEQMGNNGNMGTNETDIAAFRKLQLIRCAFRDESLNSVAKLVFAVVVDHCSANRNHENYGYAWPSYSTIADECGCGKSTAMAAMKELSEKGWFYVMKRFDEHKQQNFTNLYRPNWDRVRKPVPHNQDHPTSENGPPGAAFGEGGPDLGSNTSYRYNLDINRSEKQKIPFSERDISLGHQEPVDESECDVRSDCKALGKQEPHPLPPGWRPKESAFERMMRDHGFTREQVEDEIDYFVEFYSGYNGQCVLRSNWDAVWARWSQSPKVFETGMIEDPKLQSAWQKFIGVFPNKYAINAGREAFERVVRERRAAVSDLIKGAEAYSAHIDRHHGFREQPVTSAVWLGHERWTDEYQRQR